MAKKPTKPDGVLANPRHKKRTSGATKTLRTLISEGPSKDDLDAINTELAHGSDRACAIIAAANLETTLTVTILTKLENIDEETVENLTRQNGALDGFLSKIYLGYALALYDKATRDDLDTIRKIRNAFAHSRRPITFLEKEISAACGKLNHKSAKSFSDPHATEKFRQIGYPRMSQEQETKIAPRSVWIVAGDWAWFATIGMGVSIGGA
jgi:DNA-binding MltR family transcriptional regulator